MGMRGAYASPWQPVYSLREEMLHRMDYSSFKKCGGYLFRMLYIVVGDVSSMME
jgi:hypothetical protein